MGLSAGVHSVVGSSDSYLAFQLVKCMSSVSASDVKCRLTVLLTNLRYEVGRKVAERIIYLNSRRSVEVGFASNSAAAPSSSS